MIQAIIPSLLSLIGKAVDKGVKDKDQAEKLKAEITLAALSENNAELQGAIDIILAEAKGESWLQRNWRPMLMLWFAALVGAHWFGYTPENLGEKEVLLLLEIVKFGIGGYVLGRSGEKMVKAYKAK